MNQPTAETRRLFFALWPDDEVRQRLAAASRHWSRHPVPEHNLHMTLVFLGDCTPEQRVCYCAAAAAVEVECFTLELNFLGGRARSRIQWLGSSDTPDALRSLVRALSRGLQECGFEPEKRRFLPHVTLSRKVRNPVVKSGLEALVWPVDRFALVESMPEPGGVRYQVLEGWPLRQDG